MFSDEPQLISEEFDDKENSFVQPIATEIETFETDKLPESKTETQKLEPKSIPPRPKIGENKKPSKPRRRRGDKNWNKIFERPIRSDPRSVKELDPTFHRRKGRHPAIEQQLSPKALYSRPPSSADKSNKKVFGKFENPKFISAANGSSSSGGNGSSSDGGSSGSSSSGGNGGGGGYLKIGGNSSDGLFGSGGNNGGKSSDLDLDQFDYPDSPTSHKWLADNNDLSPLTVLDNINLKTEFPYSSSGTEMDKPPDINSITLDSGAEHLFQFAASVPDSSSTLLDIGTDSFSQSLYDDLGDINLADFPSVGAFASVHTSTIAPTNMNNNNNSNNSNSNTINISNNINNSSNNSNILSLLAAATPVPTSMATSSAIQSALLSQLPVSSAGILQKPITLEKLNSMYTSGTPVTISGNGFPPIQFSLKALDTRSTVDVGTLNLAGLLPVARAVVAAAAANDSNGLSSPPSALKSLEPLPASALKGLIKSEPSPNIYTGLPFGIKTEEVFHPDFETSVFSPASLYSASIASPGSPGSSPGVGGGKMKSSARKKSTSSSSTADDDDISNIPSLQMRIQIISQRVS